MLITTLPVTVHPFERMGVGSILGPFVVDLAAQYFSAQPVIAMNTLGRRIGPHAQVDVSEYIKALGHSGILTDVVWQDSLKEYRVFFSQFLHDSFSVGIVGTTIGEILTCPCGALESPRDHLRSFGKVYTTEKNGSLICKACLQKASVQKGCSLVYKFPTELFQGVISPLWVHQEANNLQSKFAGSELRISRFRETGIVEKVGGNIFHIDIDFFWSCYLMYLGTVSSEKNFLIVTSNRTMRQSFFVAWLTNQFFPKSETGVLVTPILKYIRQNKEVVNNLLLHEFEGKDCSDIRLMLGHALTWGAKEALVSSDVWYWIKHSNHPQKVFLSEKSSGPASIDEFIRIASHTTSRTLLASLRKERILTPQESALYGLLQHSV